MTAFDQPPHESPTAARGPLRPLWDAITSGATQVVSTDVFDTLVWRKVTEPVDAFPLIGEALRGRGVLAAPLGPETFGALRQAAEVEVRARRLGAHGQTEVRLDEIYEVVPDWVFTVPDGRAIALEEELAVEAGLLVPDLDVVELLLAAKELGRRVVAVSDTYFTPAQLRRLLDLPVARSLELDHVFTSCDHRTNKSGGLFDIVLERLGVEAEAVVHLGDNHEADVAVPGARGLRTFYVERLPEELERVMEGERRFGLPRVDTVDAGRVAGGLTASRAKAVARAHALDLPQQLSFFWRYGAGVLGPVMTGFAEWVHAYAEREGVRRVACAMREGAFLSELIGAAGPALGSELEAAPLWVNRDLCLRASIATAEPDELGRLMSRRSALTVADACRTLGVPMSRLPGLASHAQTRTDDPVVRHELFAAIAADADLQAEVVNRARDLRRRIARHVEEVVPSADGKLVMVDLGWGASIQRMLAEILAMEDPGREVAGLYLLTHAGAARHALRDAPVPAGTEVHGYIGSFGVPGVTDQVLRSPEVLEQVFMPPHGTQLDLDEDARPVVAPGTLPAPQLREAEAVRRGISGFQGQWARYRLATDGAMPRLADAADLLRPLLLRSVVAPTREEAARFGAWQHDEGQGSARTDAIADERAIERLRWSTPGQALDLPMTELYWPHALASKVDEHWPGLLLAAASGDVAWEALGSPLDLGPFEVSGGEHADAPQKLQPQRNWLGRSLVTTTLRGAHIPAVELQPGNRPSILRLDWIDLLLHVQGDAEPLRVRLDAAGGLEHLQVVNTFRLQPNVLIVHGTQPSWTLPLAPFTKRVVHRVDLDLAFMAMEISPVLPGGGRFSDLEDAEREVQRKQAELDAMRASPSWRATAPLRKLKRVVR